MPIAHGFEYVKVIYHRAVFFLALKNRGEKVTCYSKIDIAPNQLVKKLHVILR